MERTSTNKKEFDIKKFSFEKHVEANCSDIQFILNKARELNRHVEPEYRFLEEFKENIQLYEQILIKNGIRT